MSRDMTCDICGSEHDTQGHVDSLHRMVNDPEWWTGPQHTEITVRTLAGLLRLAGLTPTEVKS